jgi:hypothetical protein
MSAPTRRVRLAVGTGTWDLPVWRTCSRCGAGVWVARELADAQYVACRECASRTNAPRVPGLDESPLPRRNPPLGRLTPEQVERLRVSSTYGTARQAPRRFAPEGPRRPVRPRSGFLTRWRASRRLRRAERAARGLQRGRLTALRDRERSRLWDVWKREAFAGDERLRERFVEWDDEESDRIEAELYDDLRALYPKASEDELALLVESWRVLARDLPVVRRAEP